MLTVALAAGLAFPQAPPPAPANDGGGDVTFTSKVTLVAVPVTVRDRKGLAVGNLKQEDFELFDNGVKQTIVKFSVESSAARRIPLVPAGPAGGKTEATPRYLEAPGHFVAYLFDDIHLNFVRMAQMRGAAQQHFRKEQPAGTRFALYTTSGTVNQEFTGDRGLIERAILQLRSKSRTHLAAECPDISFYAADAMLNRADRSVIDAITGETATCMNITIHAMAEMTAMNLARRVEMIGREEARTAMGRISAVVGRLASMPGERTLILASSGIFRPSDRISEDSHLIDRAVRANIVINALNARGLEVELPDISRGLSRAKVYVDRSTAFAEGAVMDELANGTGGAYFRNGNDLSGALGKLSGAPETHYVLGFSPQNLKRDGTLHKLRVKLKEPSGLEIHARRGYFAPNENAKPVDEAKQAIADALFSHDEMDDIPFVLETKVTDVITVNARVDVRGLRYKTAGNRSTNDVEVATALFDSNGTFKDGVTKTVRLRLKDETLRNKLNDGLDISTDFKVARGNYFVRVVIRDSEARAMGARNAAVEFTAP